MGGQFDCPECGVELDGGANFCINCGTDVSAIAPTDGDIVCPDCGTDVPATDNFCITCGAALSDRKESTAADASYNDAIAALDSQSGESDSVPDSLVLAFAGHEMRVTDGETVGRKIRAGLSRAGRPETEVVRIHREHVRFFRESDSFYLLDMGDNPTHINGNALSKGERKAVGPGDELELSGVASITIQSPSDSSQR